MLLMSFYIVSGVLKHNYLQNHRGRVPVVVSLQMQNLTRTENAISDSTSQFIEVTSNAAV